jgi:XTP/dITP diphosphohydrolase
VFGNVFPHYGLSLDFIMAKYPKPKKVLIATGNRGKITELTTQLSSIGVEVVSLADLPLGEPVEETGSTFTENAKIKAAAYAIRSGLYSLADDSGLEVDALDGRPGVYSARYGGDQLMDHERVRLLLDEMRGVQPDARTARFVASLAFAAPDGRIIEVFDGICGGSIAESPAGEGGFGYDPIFIPEGYDRTFGELSPDIKGRISHRSQAVAKFIRFLPDFTGV